MENFQLNKYQTPITQELLDSMNEEIKEQFFDYINNVPYIKRLISSDRPYARDLPRDSEGKIIIDITKPHILEDTDYFRPTAIHFQKTGRLTDLKPNANPNSEFGKWIREEIRRCYEGYVRPSDGEWITGDMYFFLNYCPMQLIKKDAKGKTIRSVGMPLFWEGHYYKFHFLQQCRDSGHHYMELSRRGCGKSFCGASLLAKRFILGEGYEVNKKVQCVVTASERKYIQGANQILDMFQYYIDFCASNTQFPSRRLTSSLQNMQWTMGYLDVETGVRMGTENSVMGITSKDDESKLRGSRGVLYIIEESGCHLKGTKVMLYNGTFKNVEDVTTEDLLMGDDGTSRKVLELYSGIDDMYKITLSNGDTQIVNSRHPIYFKSYNWNTKKYTEHLMTAPQIMQIKDLNKGNYIYKSDKVAFPYKELKIDPYWIGLWLGDGDKTRMAVSNEDPEVLDWLETYCMTNCLRYSKRYLKQSKKCYNLNISSKNALFKEFISLNLKNNKHLPDIYKYNSKEVLLNILAGVIDTDGTLNRKKQCYEITQVYKNKQIIDDIAYISRVLGFRVTITTKVAGQTAKGAGHLNYRLRISGDIDKIPVKIERKKIIKRHTARNRRNWNEYTFKVEPYGKGEYYGFTIDKNHLFLLDDFTITHNTFPRLLNLWQVLRPSVEDGDSVWGIIAAWGTAGDNDSDFSSMQELMYNPKGYNVLGINNIYDKEGQGRKQFTYFFPGYLNRADCYDKDGNSDVIKALVQILKDRYLVKYNSTNINAITKRIAEIPITPQEAIQRAKGNIFPITELTARLNEIDGNPNFYDDTYVGNLIFNKKHEVEFQPSYDKPIRDFPLKDNKSTGALEIFEMPQEVQGKIPQDRYIASLDNYENDESNTMSLGSLFVMDLWTDKIVAEYTGRPMFVDDLNEIARKVCLFYNCQLLYESNKKNTFSYFSRTNSLYMLADTPEYLRNKQLIKSSNFGNSSKGVQATVPIKNFGLTLIRDWLLKPVTINEEQDGHEVSYTVPNLSFIKNRALLKELILFNPDINVDRLMSLIQLMLFREEKMILYQGDMQRAQAKPKGLEMDPFFEKNYRQFKLNTL